MDEILKYAVENGIIDLSYVQEKIEMNKRKEYLEKHPWKIFQGSDEKWRTYLPDENRKRRMIKRNSQKELEDIVIKYYKEREEKEIPKTFDFVYWNWRKSQDELISENSVVKYNTDYKRYFEGTNFSNMRIEKITEEDIKVFIVRKIKELGLCQKAAKTLFGYIKNTVNSARINRMIRDNPMEFLQAKQFYKYCENVAKPKDKRIISDEEMKKLYCQFQEDYRNHPEYIPTYAVHLASLTGMRVGELSALSWDSITDTYILINKSEKYNRKTKEYYIDKTKNGKERIFPLTDGIAELLKSVKEVETQHGYLCEWVFAGENGRIHAPIISSCSKNKCRQVGIGDRGIHAYRRTINSKMRCNGVSATVAASLLGHTEEVNEQYYTYDITDIKQKAGIVSAIEKIF